MWHYCPVPHHFFVERLAKARHLPPPPFLYNPLPSFEDNNWWDCRNDTNILWRVQICKYVELSMEHWKFFRLLYFIPTSWTLIVFLRRKLLNKCFNFYTFTEHSSKIVITGTSSIASFINVNTASPILTCDVGTGWNWFLERFST